MLRQFKYKEIVWLDLEKPTEEEIAEIGQQYGIHPVALAELKQPSARAKVDLYQNFFYLILQFANNQEIDFVVGKNFIITTHYEEINPLHDFAKIFETDLPLKKNRDRLHGAFVFYYILREMYMAMENNLNAINERLKVIEPKVFSGKEREVVTDLAGVSRGLLDNQWNLKSHRDVLDSLEHAGLELFGVKFAFYFKSIISEYEKIWNMIESIHSTFLELRQTNESLLAIKTNETVKLLTVLAFIFFPLSVVPQVFGMNTALPLIGQPYDFYAVLALMGLSSILMYVLARHKRWF